jgi:hypothetical protein
MRPFQIKSYIMTNKTTRRHQELRLPIGSGADQKPFHIVIGYLLETDWGQGRKSYDVELCPSHLQPVLYQQVKAATSGAATVVCDKADFAKRYKVSMPVKAPTEPGEESESEGGDQ